MTECKLWTGRLNSDGYGRSGHSFVHRRAYEQTHGPIPEGLEIDHLCGNRACFEPSHLEAVTRRENIMRSSNFAAINARKTHCDNGHEFTDKNTYRWGGWRYCRACNLAAQKRKRERPTPRNTDEAEARRLSI